MGQRRSFEIKVILNVNKNPMPEPGIEPGIIIGNAVSTSQAAGFPAVFCYKNMAASFNNETGENRYSLFLSEKGYQMLAETLAENRESRGFPEAFVLKIDKMALLHRNVRNSPKR